MLEPLSSPAAYQKFVYALPRRYPSIQRSTLVYIPSGNLFGRLDGMVVFTQNVMLCVTEILNFEMQAIASYGYEVSRSPTSIPMLTTFPLLLNSARRVRRSKTNSTGTIPFPTRIFRLWQPHPHHKHIHPDIKHNRIPASNISFTRPNLPILIEEIESLTNTGILPPANEITCCFRHLPYANHQPAKPTHQDHCQARQPSPAGCGSAHGG